MIRDGGEGGGNLEMEGKNFKMSWNWNSGETIKMRDRLVFTAKVFLMQFSRPEIIRI